MPELTDEEFFSILGVSPQRENLENLVSVPPEASDLPALVNADGTQYPARRNAPNVLRPVAPASSLPHASKLGG
ncbi:MAG: hypothetical protein FD180_4302 [Planctomycetota bacterium]|nr:MAG: hypothetical protein FD180_4302 [Planctomycetota bacterium]